MSMLNKKTIENINVNGKKVLVRYNYFRRFIMNNSGCFKHCTNCSSEVVCCSYFDKINAPVLNKEELQKIKEIVKNEHFYEVLGQNLFSLKLTGNNCIF